MSTTRPATRGEPLAPVSTQRIPLGLRGVGLKAVWDQRHSLIWWTGGSALLSVIVVLLFPYIEGGEELEALLQQMPPAIQALIGEEIDLATAPGYLDIRMFTAIAPIIFLIYAIGRGNAAISAEEARGTMDLLLSQPVPRWRIPVEHAMATFAGLIVIGAGLWGGLVFGALIADVEFSFNRAAQATFMGVLLGLFYGGLALAIGAGTGRTGAAIGASAAVGVAGYLLHSLAPLVDWLEPFRVFSPFYHYIGQSAMLEGMRLSSAAVLAISSACLIVVAILVFQRRDVQIGQ